MDLATIISLCVMAVALGFGLVALEGWLRSDGSIWAQAWTSYKLWYTEQADYLFERQTAEEYVKQHVIIALSALLLGIFVTVFFVQVPLLAMGFFAAGIFFPFQSIKSRVEKRRHDLLMQIDPALQFMANALQAAPNLEEALLLVSQHLKPPISEEMRRVVTSYRMGVRLDDALQQMADRCSEPFVTSMVMALIVGRRTGGNIAQTLRDIALSTREVTKVERDLQAKTKGQQNQFYLVLAIYPLCVLALKEGLPSAWETLIHTTEGLIAFVISGLIAAVAIVWARSILSAKNL